MKAHSLYTIKISLTSHVHVEIKKLHWIWDLESDCYSTVILEICLSADHCEVS